MTTQPDTSVPATLRSWTLRGLLLSVVVFAAACSGGGAAQAVTSEQESTRLGDNQHIDIELGDGLGVDTTSATTTELDNGNTEIAGSVVVPVEGGSLDLDDAQIIVGEDPVTGEPFIVAGRSRVPFPDTGVLAGAVVKSLPVGDMGIAFGRDLLHLGAHVQDDRQYFYWHFDGGLDIDLPFAGQPGLEALPASVTVPTGQSATMVLDPTDPYLYIGSACPDLSQDTDDEKKDDPDEKDQSSRTTSSTSTTQPTRDEADESGGLYTLEPTDLPPGEDCGIGFSLQGNIPGRTMGDQGDGTGFSGNVVVDGIIPLYAGVELDGTAVLSVNENGAHTAGWGDVIATVPLIDQLLDIAIPLAEAGVEIEVEGDRIGLSYEGTVGGHDPTYELPFLGISITIPVSGGVEASARFGFINDGTGTYRIDPTSFLDINGELSTGLGSLGELLGLELTDFASQQAALRIDHTGARLTGSALLQIHPALHTDAEADFDMYISATDLAESYLRFDADLEVAGTELLSANVDLSRQGLFVNGNLDIGTLEVDLSGAITTTGVDLRGRAAVEFPTDVLSEISAGATQAIDTAQAEVNRLDDAIAAARQSVIDRRRARSAAFQNAKAVLDIAIADLAAIDDNIAINNRKIRDHRRWISDETARYGRLSLGSQILEATAHGLKISAWEAAILAFQSANTVQMGYQVAARETLRVAQDALDLIDAGLNEIPVDADPTVLALIGTRETATLALQAARDGAELLDVDLAATIRGEIELFLSTSGLGGSVTAEFCGTQGCQTLAGGSVRLDAEPEACVDVFGLGEACVRL